MTRTRTSADAVQERISCRTALRLYASGVPLDVLVPDLLLPPDAPESLRSVRMPALERWLVRGDATRLPHRSACDALAASFALPSPAPVAAVTLAADAAPQPGTWLRADPVHVRVEANGAALHDPAILGIERDEATALVAALQAAFAEDGLAFVAPTPSRWYVRVPPGEAPTTVPLAEALGRNAFALLPRGNGSVRWPALLTEAQMLLAAHPVNERRERAGKPAINTLWLWGEGETPASVGKPYALVHANDPFATGLAKLSGTRHAELPRGFEGIDAVGAEESALVVLDAMSAPLRAGDAAAWTAAAQRLDEAWFAEMDRALPRFERITILLPTGRDTAAVHVRAQARFRWLRRSRPLAHHA